MTDKIKCLLFIREADCPRREGWVCTSVSGFESVNLEAWYTVTVHRDLAFGLVVTPEWLCHILLHPECKCPGRLDTMLSLGANTSQEVDRGANTVSWN